jgi:hypothetical protein
MLPERLMNRIAAATTAPGIGHARDYPMRNLISLLSPERKDPCETAARAAKQRKKIWIAFKNDDVPRCIKILIKDDSVPGKASCF